MRTVKGHVPISNTRTINRLESLDRYLPMIGKYFETACNCSMSLNISGMDNLFVSYTNINRLEACGNCTGGCVEIADAWNFPKKDPVWEFAHTNLLTPEFMRVERENYYHRLCPNSKLITIKSGSYNRVIGEYCPHRNILYTSDWTHDADKVEFVNKIFNILVTSGLLKERKVEKKVVNVTLGTDPEFELEDDEGRVIDCREAGIRDRVIKPGASEGQIGQDGAGHQREIRPDPSDTPEGLIKNIEALIIEAIDENWSLKGRCFPLGGHIHVGGVDVSWDFVELLDYLLLPLTELNSDARKSSRYSKIEGNSDRMRPQKWGLEYRVPPAGYLASKDLAYVTLKIVKLAAQKHYNGEDVEITDNLKNDLQTLGLTEKEVSTFFSEIKKFKENGLPNNLKIAWGITKVKPKFIIEFRDTWSNDARNFIDKIAKAITKDMDIEGKIVFYGLSGERGRVFSVDVEKMEGLTLPGKYGIISQVKNAGKYSIGFPSSIRGSLSETASMSSTIEELIRRTLLPKQKKPKKTKQEDMDNVIIPEGWFRESTTGYYTTTSSPYILRREE